MLQHIRKIRFLLKTVFIFSVISCTFLIYFLTEQFQADTQTFDLKAAVLISLGFGASVSLLICYMKKY